MIHLARESDPSSRVVIAGGGAAGFFAAITCGQAAPAREVIVLEGGSRFLAKVRISGGGRCNVTHACFDPRELSQRYPRGGRALIGPFHRFQPRDTDEWFSARGVQLKTESDGRMFPVTNSSATVVDCLIREAESAGVALRAGCGVKSARPAPGGFALELTDGGELACEKLCIATGGCRTPAAARWIEALGHSIEPPVPSLFTFHIETPWLRALPGLAVGGVEASVPGTKLCERGPLLVTHWGVSGPVILRLSAWGARELHARDYQFPLQVNWLPGRSAEDVLAELRARRESQPGRAVASSPLGALPSRLWESLVSESGIGRDVRWTTLSRPGAPALADRLTRTEFPVTGKSLNKEEFVTCGGVRLREVDFQTMESRVQPGLYFAGEVLDIDGVTGGFNFQAAWTTGWIAGHAMAVE
ncbi:MAG: NAD(P)/FAD-dependent oxidoreductase [Terrimicrobiaceae bacterium]|nr:NAD(P)/FAD-dependent oxidoreductase [Terrimicrobiaceae bacterium]